MIYLCNTFSPQMLPRLSVGEGRKVMIERISASNAFETLRDCDVVSCFGHKCSAWHLSRYLRLEILPDRGEICLRPEDTLIVAAVVNKNRWLQHVDGVPKWVFYKVTSVQ